MGTKKVGKQGAKRSVSGGEQRMWVLRHARELPRWICPPDTFWHQPIPGVNRLPNAVWHHFKAVFVVWHSSPPTDPPWPRRFSPDVVEMITVHLKYNTLTLKAFPTYIW